MGTGQILHAALSQTAQDLNGNGVNWTQLAGILISLAALTVSIFALRAARRNFQERFGFYCQLEMQGPGDQEGVLKLTFVNKGKVPIVVAAMGLSAGHDKLLLVPRWNDSRPDLPKKLSEGEALEMSFDCSDLAIEVKYQLVKRLTVRFASGKQVHYSNREIKRWRQLAIKMASDRR